MDPELQQSARACSGQMNADGVEEREKEIIMRGAETCFRKANK